MQRKAAQAFSAQRQSTLALLHHLDHAQWEQPCLPPWGVREVVAHLVTVDEASASGRMLWLLRSHGRDDLERWNDAVVTRLSELSPTELIERLEQAGTRLQRRLRRWGPLARLPLRTTFGRQPIGFLVCRRVVDEWVHANDIARVADGAAVQLGEGVPEALAIGTLDALAVLTLPRLTERVGVVRLVVETGVPGEPDGPRRVWGIDFARRQYGPRVTARPDATIRLHAGDLALLTEGRAGSVEPTIEGDEALAARLLKGLAS